MAPPKTAPPTTSLRFACEDRAPMNWIKEQIGANTDRELIAVIAAWAMRDPNALTALRVHATNLRQS